MLMRDVCASRACARGTYQGVLLSPLPYEALPRNPRSHNQGALTSLVVLLRQGPPPLQPGLVENTSCLL